MSLWVGKNIVLHVGWTIGRKYSIVFLWFIDVMWTKKSNNSCNQNKTRDTHLFIILFLIKTANHFFFFGKQKPKTNGYHQIDM